LGTDYNDPFLIDEMMNKDNKTLNKKDLVKLNKLFYDFIDIDNQGKETYELDKNLPDRYKYMIIRNKNKINIRIPLFDEDFKRDHNLKKRLENSEGKEAETIEQVLFNNSYKKEILRNNPKLTDRISKIKQNTYARGLTMRLEMNLTANDLLKNQFEPRKLTIWQSTLEFFSTPVRPLLPSKNSVSFNEQSIKDGIQFVMQIISFNNIPLKG